MQVSSVLILLINTKPHGAMPSILTMNTVIVETNGNHRVTCIDKMEFDENG
ncbi:hypothetical protein AAKU52_002066 [Pedobacter sp. CG_S7]